MYLFSSIKYKLCLVDTLVIMTPAAVAVVFFTHPVAIVTVVHVLVMAVTLSLACVCICKKSVIYLLCVLLHNRKIPLFRPPTILRQICLKSGVVFWWIFNSV